jgi:hypothetical protein
VCLFCSLAGVGCARRRRVCCSWCWGPVPSVRQTIALLFNQPLTPALPLFFATQLLQARAEDYSEALAFVRLLNALWRSGGGAALADGGRCTAHLTKFVREDLLSTLFQVLGMRHCRAYCREQAVMPGSRACCWVCAAGRAVPRDAFTAMALPFLSALGSSHGPHRKGILPQQTPPSSPLPCSAPFVTRRSGGSWRPPALSTASCAWRRCRPHVSGLRYLHPIFALGLSVPSLAVQLDGCCA